MGGEGSMSFANQSLKYNRGQLRRKSFKDIREQMRYEAGKTLLEFEQIDPLELEEIKSRIRLKARRERKKLLWVSIISLLLTIVVCVLVFSYL